MSGSNVRLKLALLEKMLDKPVFIIYNIICSLERCAFSSAG